MRLRRRSAGPGSTRRLRPLLLVGVGVGVTALAVIAYGTNLLRSLELTTVNTRFQIRGTERPPSNVVVVGIDATTFDELDEQWPFPRYVHARVIRNIAKEDPRVILYDVQFSEASTCPVSRVGVKAAGKCNFETEDEEELLSALQEAHGSTVMATTETEADGNTRFLGSDEGTALLKSVDSRPGDALFPPDPGGVIRRLEYKIDGLRTLAVVGAEVARHRAITPRLFRGGTAWIDYYGPSGLFHHVSFSKVDLGHFPRGTFRHKIVVVGPFAPSLQDLHPTSTAAQMPGAEIQASALETVLRGLPLRSIPTAWNVVLIILLGLTVPLIALRANPLPTIAIALVLGAIFTVAVQLAFNSGDVVSFVYPAAALALATAAALSVQLVTVAFERERVRDLFSRFVPSNVVDEVLASTHGGLRLGGVQREGTVMFTDLRGFTSFAESLKPEEVIEVLNHYLSEMSDAILDHGGTLVAYMGDGIMAVFGAPIAQEDHADRALATAREMLSVRLPSFNARVQERALGSTFRMGIGLNSGSVMSGNVGSERRVEYTAVGDTTNVASRIEQLTKGTPHQLMLSGATKEALTDPPSDLIFVEEVDIRGRQGRTSIWSLPEETDSPRAAERDAQPESV